MKLILAATVLVSLSLTASGCMKERPARAVSDGATPATSGTSAPRTTLLTGFQPYHRDITTGSDAQAFFDEGLTLLYGFNHEEAFASFAQAAALDSVSPMPHWGMALSLGTNINDAAPADRIARAYVHLAAASRRRGSGSAVEQGLIDALSQRYSANPSGDQSAREASYSAAMGALAKRFPSDPDVAVLYAESMMNLHPWQLYRADGSPETWTPAIVSTLERVLTAEPLHPGANHYYVHAVEASASPARALRSAVVLETRVPGAGHLVHMPAHIYIRTGQYAKAARSNALAAAVDERYFARATPQTFYAMAYYGHNLQFESAAAMFAGNFAEARSAATRTVALADPAADQMAMLEPFAAMEALVCVRFADWSSVLALKTPAPARSIQRGLYHWARGSALAHTARPDDAQQQLDSLQQLLARVPKDAMVGPLNWGGSVLAVAVPDLRGRVAMARGDTAGAIAAYRLAVEAEDRLAYNEPADWLLPERERLGAALLAVGKATEAERVFRADLTRNVGNPWSLHGIWRSLVMQRRRADAERARRAFDAAWHHADVALGEDLLPTK